MLQSLFQFELGHCKNPDSVEKQISNISSIKDGTFVERCEEIIREAEDESDDRSEDLTRIIITGSVLPHNYILKSNSWRPEQDSSLAEGKRIYEPSRFYVLSVATFFTLHPDIPVEKFLLRQIQRICMRVVIPSNKGIQKKRLSHNETRGCLFDFNRIHYDARYLTNLAFICEDCVGDFLDAPEIPEGYRKGFFDQFQQWLIDSLPETSEICKKVGDNRIN
jgi:hypothetical protein